MSELLGPSPDELLDDEELRYSGRQCRRCGCPLLDGEGTLCGGKNPDGLNCSLTMACQALARAGGPRSYQRIQDAPSVRQLWAVE